MVTWASKDPDAVLDYVYTIPLDVGDTVASYTFVKLTGTAIIDSQSRTLADVTAWISGGTEAETNVFRITWTTATGRHTDDVITLGIAESDPVALALTGYAKPGANHLIMRYPAFGAVPVATMRYWLTDAQRYVTTAWGEGDYAAGLMSLAAHNMALAGLGTDTAGLAGLPRGINRVRSGSLDFSLTTEAANAQATGSLQSTRYGQEYALLLASNRGGPLISPTGVPPYDIYAGAYPIGWQ